MSNIGRERPFSKVLERLRGAGLRPTRQRLALAKLLFDGPDRHVTAENLHSESDKGGANVSLATVYNTLHQFTDVGLLKEVVVASGSTYFDTNVSSHHHFFFADENRLEDIAANAIEITRLPMPPAGKKFSRLDVVIHVSDED